MYDPASPDYDPPTLHEVLTTGWPDRYIDNGAAGVNAAFLARLEVADTAARYAAERGIEVTAVSFSLWGEVCVATTYLDEARQLAWALCPLGPTSPKPGAYAVECFDGTPYTLRVHSLTNDDRPARPLTRVQHVLREAEVAAAC